MAGVRAHWRAMYAPGEWIVLSGPTSLVVLQPFSDEYSALVNTLWEEVLASSSIVDLTERLAAQGLDEMPSFGAFFWTDAGMRSVVRGAVRVVDVATHRVVADAPGVQTWGDVGLGAVARVQLDLPTATEGGRLQLPLAVGAVRASMITLDAHPGQHLSSPQSWSVPAARPPAALAAPAADWAHEMENGDTELMEMPELADLELATARTWPGDQPVAAPPVPGIALSDGRVLGLAQPVRIGRAPSADRGREILLVVSSPNSDISRTHLQIGLRDGQVVVTDLNSTNGTLLQRPGAGEASEQLEPGTVVPVPIGSRLDLGDGVSVRIEPSVGPT